MYSSPRIYTLAMRVLYWPHFADRYRVVADLIPEGATVVDACCGDAFIYKEYLRRKGVRYIGLDSSPAMVNAGIDAGLDVRLWNAVHDDVPKADIVLIQGALCHFISDADLVLSKLRAAARELLIVSEPIRPTRRSDSAVVSALSKAFTQPLNDDGTYKGERFTKQEFEKLLNCQPELISSQIVPGGREMVAVLRGGCRR